MKKAKILIADDSEHLQELFSDLLTAQDYEVLQALNGDEAVALAASATPDFVMLDVMMPRLSGLEVLKHIKARSPDTIVVMMTAHGTEETAVEAMKLGADDYLVKPLAYKEVLKLVSELLYKKQTRQENIRLKERIHETEAYLAHLINNVNEAIISTDECGKIQSFNRAAERLWNTDEVMMINMPLSSLFKNSDNVGYVDNILDLTKKEGKYEGEFIFQRDDNTDFPGYLSTSLVNDLKEMKEGVVAVIRDLTSEKILRERLVESAKLASLGKVAEGIAHEIRNPLISMGGFARRLAKKISQDGEEKKYLNIILENVSRMERMVKDVEDYVNFTKLHKANFRAVHVQDVILDVLSRLDLQSARVSLSLDEQKPPPIYGDEGYLKELFHDIFENSLEAMIDGGHLKIDFDVDDKYLTVIIKDTGCGIPKDKLDDIYDPFYTSKMSGAGIGLAKAHLMVEEHHGIISVESEKGKGTSFHIKLPREKRQPARLIK